MKYARPVVVGDQTRLTDVVDIPEPLPFGGDVDGFLAIMFPTVKGFVKVADDAMSGAVQQPDGSYTNPIIPAPPPQPKLLSKTAFQDYAVSQLGGGMVGMGRFTDIMDATRDSASSAVRFAFARYEAADVFEKTNTATLTAIMVSAAVMTADERTAIIDNWPTG